MALRNIFKRTNPPTRRKGRDRKRQANPWGSKRPPSVLRSEKRRRNKAARAARRNNRRAR